MQEGEDGGRLRNNIKKKQRRSLPWLDYTMCLVNVGILLYNDRNRGLFDHF